MRVEKIIETKEETELEILGATLLSINEAQTSLTKEERTYACRWWLRSPGIYQHYAAYVFNDGSVHYFGNQVHCDSDCVRPALQISNPKSSNLKIGDIFVFEKKRFKIISDELAFCLEDIGMCCFRKDWKADDANNYEKSDVKKFVDEWFSGDEVSE